MPIPEILEAAVNELDAKKDDFGNVTPGAMADAIRAASMNYPDTLGFNTAFTYLAAGMQAQGVPDANRMLQEDYRTSLPLEEAVRYFRHAIETYRSAKK